MRKLIFLLATVLSITFSITANCKEIKLPPQNIHEFTLDNGLKLVVRPDRRAPVVVSYVWYRVGSADEPGGLTGISHVLEHMMFKGTPRYPQGVFSKIIAEHGGKENAFTSTDYTAYYQELAADNLELSFKLEADRMQNLMFSPEEYKKEIEVVKEERRMRIDDNPNALTYERFNAAAHIAHPYHHLTIGWMSDIEQITVADLKRWYDQWYAPNNAVLVVVGNVNPQETFRLAKKYFNSIPRKTLPPSRHFPEPKPLGERRLTVKAPAQLPLIIIGYNVPSFKTAKHQWEVYALNVLDGILSSGNSSRLARRLIRGSQIASNISCGYDLYDRYDSLFMCEGTPSQKHNITELEKAIHQEIEQLKNAPVTEKELKRIKAKILAHYIYDKDSLSNQAYQIGALETNGISWHEIENYINNINAISAEQVQQVAKKYLTSERLTTALLKPLPMELAQPRKSNIKGARHGR